MAKNTDSVATDDATEKKGRKAERARIELKNRDPFDTVRDTVTEACDALDELALDRELTAENRQLALAFREQLIEVRDDADYAAPKEATDDE